MAEKDRMPAPWVVVDHPESYEVQDATGQTLAYLYFEDEPGRRRATNRISKDMARRLASQIAKLPKYIADAKEDDNG